MRQTKRYESAELFTIGSPGTLSEIITNTDNLKVNWHGIRFKGRIRADNASADNETHGFCGIMCIDQEGVAVPQLLTEGNLNQFYPFIVAVEPWSVFGGSTNPNQYGSQHDFDYVIKTSRTCPKEGRLIGFVSNNGAKSVVATTLLSTFETQG